MHGNGNGTRPLANSSRAPHDAALPLPGGGGRRARGRRNPARGGARRRQDGSRDRVRAAERRAPILVVCPAIAQGVWQAEVAKWWPEARAVLLRDLVAGEDLPDGPTFVIASYDYLVANARAREVVAALEFDLGIGDEVHACKTPDGQAHPAAVRRRAAPAAACSTAATRVILLTGTPTPNGLPSELWPALRRFAPDLIDHLDYDAVRRTYCTFKLRQVQTRYGVKTIEQIAGASARAPELARAIAPFWHRPPREEVERDLPPLRMVTRRLPAEMLDSQAIGKLEKSPEAEQLRAAIEDGDLRGVEGQLAAAAPAARPGQGQGRRSPGSRTCSSRASRR